MVKASEFMYGEWDIALGARLTNFVVTAFGVV